MRVKRELVHALIAAGKAHHQALQANASNPNDWHKWFAIYLLEQTDFQTLTEREWSPSDLADALEDLHATYKRMQPRIDRAHFFAQRLDR
jgi:hypothetical protein